MSDDLVLRRMLRELKNETAPLRSTGEEAQRTQRHVAFLDELLEKKRARRRRPWALVAAAALLIALPGALRLTWSSWSSQPSAVSARATSARAASSATAQRSPEVTPLSGDVRVEGANDASERTIRATAPLELGDRLRLDSAARAVVRLGNGAVVTVSESTALRLEGGGEGEALSVSSGRVDLSVPPLRPRSLSVVTPDARVTVVGTRFSVMVEAAEAGAPGRTCVSVAEGRVSVAHAAANTLLDPGERWSSDGQPCGAPQPRAEPSGHATPWQLRAPSRALPAPSPPLEEATPMPSSAPAVSASLLAEQNRLFASALRAREQGRLVHARSLLEDFVARFPDAALAPQARRELHKLEASSSP